MMQQQQIRTNVEGLYRDMDSLGLVNNNAEALKGYKIQRAKQLELNTLNDKMNRLEAELNMMKQAIKKIGL
jgi:hypothetical protein